MTAKIPIDQLFLDPDNYRFRDSDLYEANKNITDSRTQNRIGQIISGNIDGIKNNPEIQDLIASFKANGYMPVDKIQVHKIDNKAYKVLEGNRRITALKYLKLLRDSYAEIGKMSTFDFNKIEVELYEDENLNHFRVLMGLKHISGNKKWATINQAQLIKDMSDSGESPDDICDALAISKTAYNRYIRTYALIDEYKKSDYGSQFRARMFILFEEIIKIPDLRTFIGWDNQTNKSYKKDNRDRLFNWLSTVEIEDEVGSDIENDETGNLSSGVRIRKPIIESQDQIRQLKEYINDSNFLSRMEEIGDLNSTIPLFEKTQDDVAFITALDYTERGLDAAFRSISPKVTEYYDRFMKISQKMQTLSNSFGFIEGTIPDSKEFHEANKSLTTHHISLFINSLNIKKYKKLVNIKVEFLNKINVFAGGNNAGKSTLAEIFYFIAKGTDPLGITDVVKMRRKGDNNYSNSWLSTYLEYNLPLDCNYTVSNLIAPEGKKSDFSIVLNEYRNDAGDAEKGLRLNAIEIKLDEDSTTSSIYQKRLSLPTISLQKWPVTYITSQTTYKFLVLKTSWDTVISHPGGKELIIEFLRGTFHDLIGLKDINYSDKDKEGIFRFELDNGDITHLFDYGDGIQRCFAIGLQAFMSKDGFLIIDELENGIHHSNFGKVARFLERIQSVLNLQIFITSHSLEAISDLVTGLPIDAVSYHSLYSRDNISYIESYTGSDYKFAKEENGVDLR